MIHCHNLQWGPAGQPLTPPLNLHLARASLTGVIGSNGCGKSSLLKVIAGTGTTLSGRLLCRDGLRNDVRKLHAARDPACPVCSARQGAREGETA